MHERSRWLSETFVFTQLSETDVVFMLENCKYTKINRFSDLHQRSIERVECVYLGVVGTGGLGVG